MSYEQQLLGAILKSPSHLKSVALQLKTKDLAIDVHKRIYDKVLEMQANGDWIDYPAIKERFADDEKTLSEMSKLVRSGQELDKHDLSALVKKVKTDSVKYKIKQLGANLVNSSGDAGLSPEEIIKQASAQIFDLEGAKTQFEMEPTQVIKDMHEEREKFKGKKMWGYTTGFEKADEFTRGLQKGQLWVIGAYTSVGKSWVTLHMANEAHKQGAKVLFLSTEMIEKRLAWRYVVLNTKLSEYDMISGSISHESEQRMNESIDRLGDGSFRLISGVTHVDEVIFYVKREVAKNNCDIVVVDFLQNLASGKDEYEELSNAIRKLQILALNEDVAMIVTSQISRESNKSKLGGTFGYKGSGTIEACADVGAVLIKDEDLEEIVFDVRKNRNGLTTTFKIDPDFERGILTEKEYSEPVKKEEKKNGNK